MTHRLSVQSKCHSIYFNSLALRNSCFHSTDIVPDYILISLLSLQPCFTFWYLPIWHHNKKSTKRLESSMLFYPFQWPLLYLFLLASFYCSKTKMKAWLTWFNFVDWSRLPLRQACKSYGKDISFAQTNYLMISKQRLNFMVCNTSCKVSFYRIVIFRFKYIFV